MYILHIVLVERLLYDFFLFINKLDDITGE